MPSSQITIKHNKHRVHPCPNNKKLLLLQSLVEQNSNLHIIVATAQENIFIKEAIKADNVKVFNDSELAELPELKCELLISYDLPSDPVIYISRLVKTTQNALILLDISEQKELYPIETLLKRVIKQEIITGFEYEPVQKEKKEQKSFDKPKYDKIKKEAKKSEYKPFEKSKYEKPKKNSEKSQNKDYEKPKYDKSKKDDKKTNKYLGKDENGKAIFSGKSGERNHSYDGTPKNKYNEPKKVGRKISIKARKPKDNEESLS
ncbi:hypothetical protein [Sulfurimonas xiamenensis]|jgi:superfamily II DNA/RNA helicase|uniref:Uncharacterized protein n=1 Tax=Sulfurimonas xiamenensis TaxID=2590021 RepID=A0AAJ4A285_9BACT|nr:hypothetical protein [Sulfurimonas xiamenensis]QFR42410.1 hypothetical protein FJR47_00135 [Sulfurimonas xiamenensis]